MIATNSQRERYVFVRIYGQDALLTPDAAQIAIDRAYLAPEHVPSLWQRLMTWAGW